jgi:predicted Rossmann fold flavoprotein
VSSDDTASRPSSADVAIVGAGAAGLAAAIFARRANQHVSVWLLDGAKQPGAKILISGGTRCNVTNRIVSERDFWGGSARVVRRVLRAFPAGAAVEFFRELGVPLHEEADGKLFPDSGRARDVLNALLRAVDEAGATLLAGRRVTGLERTAGGFRLTTSSGTVVTPRVVLATGGKSLPKSGSDGTGLELARQLGHSIVATTPALDPLVLETGAGSFHRNLSGVSHRVELAIWLNGRLATRLEGALLWTHFGVSGPVALNASRHWLRARVEGHDARITVSFFPGESFESLERRWIAVAVSRPRLSVLSALSADVPQSAAACLIERTSIDPARPLAHLTRPERRALIRSLTELALPVVGSRGYNFAEATAGGVRLDEINAGTMESRICPGLYLIGEMLDVDGRLGGFNFQWAWSTGYVAGQAVAAL